MRSRGWKLCFVPCGCGKEYYPDKARSVVPLELHEYAPGHPGHPWSTWGCASSVLVLVIGKDTKGRGCLRRSLRVCSGRWLDSRQALSVTFIALQVGGSRRSYRKYCDCKWCLRNCECRC